MIPNETTQTLATVGTLSTVSQFKITDATQARILVSLSDKMYTKKELAFIREYSTNAADAHIVAEKPIRDIIVTMPEMNDLNFRIRDFGAGLSEEQISEIYCVFGASTKRNSNTQNGMLGYGCKAGFAHTDSFTVTSWNNGEKSIYQCVKGDSTRLHSVELLSRCPSDEPTGLEVCIPVKQSSLWTVHRKTADFYKHWPEVPTILRLTSSEQERMEKFRATPPTLFGDGWEIRPKSEGSAVGVAYMGFVAYNLDWNVMFNRMSLTAQKRVLFELLQSNDVTLRFGMGEVQFVDSREHLEYTDFTLNALTSRIEGIFDKIKISIQEKFDSCANLWDAKLLYSGIFDTGLIEVEKGEDDPADVVSNIKILDGNLSKLELTFMNEFSWKGIPLNSCSFRKINRFDNVGSDVIGSDGHNPIEPVLITYRKKKLRTKVNRCSDTKNNAIKASNMVAVVLNDTGKKTNQALVARYLIFNPTAKIRTVHILTFVNDGIKDAFYKEYGFDSVPVVKMSEVLAEAKAWQNANRSSIPGSSSGSASREMEYFDLIDGVRRTADVPLRELEEGGVFIEMGSGRRGTQKVILHDGVWMHRSPVLTHLKTLVEKTGIDLDRVYIIPARVQDTKWFNKACDEDRWTNVWKIIKESIPEMNIDVQALVDAEAYAKCPVMHKDAADKLLPLITDTDSFLRTILATVTEKTYTGNTELVNALRSLNLLGLAVGNTIPTFNYFAAKVKMEARYPMLTHYNWGFTHGNLSDGDAKNIARYINAMDVYITLYGEEPVKSEVEETVEA